ncbi:MAG: helix-turn-helix domain-containing protein [Victivallaceae bacterium]
MASLSGSDNYCKNFSWQYYGGSRSQTAVHPKSFLRNLPFSVIVCPLEGEYYLYYPEERAPRIYRTGEVLFVPPGRPHYVEIRRRCVLHHAHISLRLGFDLDITRLLDIPDRISGGHALSIASICAEMYLLEQDRDRDFSADARQLILAASLMQIFSQAGRLKNPAAMDNGLILRLSPVFRFLKSAFRQQISRKQLAVMAGFSETRFHYVFKQIAGAAPMEYLQSLRLSNAQKLLLTTDMPISQVAEESGFANPYFFSRYFREKIGFPPSLYRKHKRGFFFRQEPGDDESPRDGKSAPGFQADI